MIMFGMELVPDIPGGAIDDVHIYVSDDFGAETSYAIEGTFPSGHTDVLILDPTGWPNPVTKAWLQYTVDLNGQPFSHGEPLIVE